MALKTWFMAAGLATIAACVPARTAGAFCAPENSPCYRWDRYSYIGSTWCRHWNFNASDQVYCLNSTIDIGPVTFRDKAAAAYQGWTNQVFGLPQLSFYAIPPGDSASVSYLMFADDATWTSRGFNPSAGAITYRRVFADGTVAHGRTWFHLKSSSWGWSPDCVTNDCSPNPPFSPGKLDFPSIAAHELGHWLVLLDISAVGCESVLMWSSMSVNQVKRTPQFSDIYGATLLYDQPVDVAVSLVATDVQPDRVNLAWYLADPGRPSATVERRAPNGAWEAHALISPDGSGYLRFTDTDVVPGSRYGYRLRLAAAGGDTWSQETWVDLPAWRLALDPVRPNPTDGASVRVRFVLPDGAPTALTLVDLAGRVARSADLRDLGPGAHVVDLGGSEPLAPGVYWVHLTHGARALTTRAVVVR